MTYERQLELTVDRLRQLPAARLAGAEEQVYALLESMTPRAVPRLRPLGWGDQLLVIGREVPPESRATLEEALRDLRRAFDLTV